MSNPTSTLLDVDPEAIEKNPQNPRRFFNDERLDVLRTSIQEVGILVPLIVYQSPNTAGRYVLLDGERRWTCSLDLGLSRIPVNIIDPPNELDNLLRMFNIHNVRDDWPLISVALSLENVIGLSGETRESRLAEMTGLTRSTVRRAKRLLSIPPEELELVRREAHLDRGRQVHREDLYLEIEAAVSVLRNELPELNESYSRPQMFRAFAAKREASTLRSVTEFRDVARLVKAVDDELVNRKAVIGAVDEMMRDVEATPARMFDRIASYAFEQQTAQRKAELLLNSLAVLGQGPLSASLLAQLTELRDFLDALLEQGR